MACVSVKPSTVKPTLFSFRAQFRIHLFSQIFFPNWEKVSQFLNFKIASFHFILMGFFYIHSFGDIWYSYIFRNKSLWWLVCFWPLNRFHFVTVKNNTGVHINKLKNNNHMIDHSFPSLESGTAANHHNLEKCGETWYTWNKYICICIYVCIGDITWCHTTQLHFIVVLSS